MSPSSKLEKEVRELRAALEAAKEGGAPGGDLAALDDKAVDSRRPSKRARDDDQDADVAEVPAAPGTVPHPRDACHRAVQFPRALLSRDSVVMVCRCGEGGDG